MEAPVRTPTRTPAPAPERVRRLSPDEVCPNQKERVVREIERTI